MHNMYICLYDIFIFKKVMIVCKILKIIRSKILKYCKKKKKTNEHG